MSEEVVMPVAPGIIPVVCSRCDAIFESMYGTDHQADGCACSLVMVVGPLHPSPPQPIAIGELAPFWVSIAESAHANNQLSPGYGSCHDLCTFAFIDPHTGEELTKHEIMDRHQWIDGDTCNNICDVCIDAMLHYKELKKIADIDFLDEDTGYEDWTSLSFERLKKLQGTAHEDIKSPAFPFARALIPSAIAAYGRPVIDTHEDESPCSITFEWQHMFWLFDKNGDQLTVVINDNPNDAIEFCWKDLKSFIADHQCIPTGMATIGDQSEFNQ